VPLPGFTTGNHTGWAGKDVGSTSATDVLVLATSYAATPTPPAGFYFKGYYKEGVPELSFADSYVELYPAGVGALDPTYVYTVSIDSINGITSLCGHTSALFTTLLAAAPAVAGLTMPAAVAAPITPLQCFAGSSELSGFPSNPRRALDLTFKFAPALPLTAGDTVTVAMPGFTRSTFQRDPPQAITVPGTNKLNLTLPIVSPTAGGQSTYCCSTYSPCTCSEC
jgi:hypothetical protein